MNTAANPIKKHISVHKHNGTSWCKRMASSDEWPEHNNGSSGKLAYVENTRYVFSFPFQDNMSNTACK